MGDIWVCLDEGVVAALGLLPTPARPPIRNGVEMTPQLGARLPLLEGLVWQGEQGTGLVAVVRPTLVVEQHRLGGAL